MEVFSPTAHIVEPMDPENVSWQNALLPKMGLLAEGDVQTNAFFFALGLAIVFIVLFAMNKMKIISDALTTGKPGK